MTKLLYNRLLMSVIILSAVYTNTAKDDEGENYVYLGNLSKYESIRGDMSKIGFKNPKCKPKKIWIIFRHGTRLPSILETLAVEKLLSVKEAVLVNHEQGFGSLKYDELQGIREWTFDQSLKAMPGSLLTEAGFNETYRAATRFKQRFPSLFDIEYSQDDFYFQHTDKQRNIQTSYAFIDGLFGNDSHKNVFQNVTLLPQDLFLAPFSGACPKLYTINCRYPYKYVNADEFTRTEDYAEAVMAISKRLGFLKPLAKEHLIAMFASCAYESAKYQETTPTAAWCAALGSEGRKAGEYYCDLTFQEVSGYGQEVTRRAGCGAVKDLWERFATEVEDLNISNKHQSVAVLFSHDTEIMLIHTSLGLLKDNPPISPYNYKSQDGRKWRTSEIVPFAANIAAVLHECTSNSGEAEYKVEMIRNEKPFEDIHGCPGGICSWINFKKLFEPVANNCNFKEFC